MTREKLAHAQTLVGEVFRALVERGYRGPPPEFGEQWRALFLRVSGLIGPKRDRRAVS